MAAIGGNDSQQWANQNDDCAAGGDADADADNDNLDLVSECACLGVQCQTICQTKCNANKRVYNF